MDHSEGEIYFSGLSPKISEGDIWWCGFGENVGVETNGKNSRFFRPVLVIKKNKSTKVHGDPTYLSKKPVHDTSYLFFDQERVCCDSPI